MNYERDSNNLHSGSSIATLPHQPAESAMPVRVTAWRPINKPPVIGAVDIVLGRSLEIFGSLVLSSNGKIWVSFPGAPQLDANDRLIRDARGKKQFTTIMKWSDRVAADRFKHSVLRAISDQYGPEALDPGDAS
jgi:hypothetical protein